MKVTHTGEGTQIIIKEGQKQDKETSVARRRKMGDPISMMMVKGQHNGTEAKPK